MVDVADKLMPMHPFYESTTRVFAFSFSEDYKPGSNDRGQGTGSRDRSKVRFKNQPKGNRKTRCLKEPG